MAIMSRKNKCMKMKLRCNTLRKDSIAMVYVIGSFLSWGHAKIKSDGIVYKSYGLYIRKVGP